MCEPTTILLIGTTVLSTGLSMYGQYQAGKAQEASAKAAAQYNAQVAENEAATRQQLAQNEIAKGVADRERQQRQAARAMGEMRAGMGASGFEMDSGTNLSLLAESAAEHQHDSNIINQNAAMAAWQQQVQGTSALNDQNYYNWQKANSGTGTATGLAMAGSLLSGIGTGLGQYNDWAKLQPSGTKIKKASVK
jgi:hypothetical protein